MDHDYTDVAERNYPMAEADMLRQRFGDGLN